jgi:hypothetical protein
LLAGSPTSELELHLAIYRRYDAGAIVHTHAPMATALACALDQLPVIDYQLLTLGGAIRVAPFQRFGARELAAAVVDALRGRAAALLANHGAVNYASSLVDAVEGAVLDLCVGALSRRRQGDRASLRAVAAGLTSRAFHRARPVGLCGPGAAVVVSVACAGCVFGSRTDCRCRPRWSAARSRSGWRVGSASGAAGLSLA